MSAEKPRIKFSPNHTLEGWRNSTFSQFNNKNGHNLFRELIQNSLDASRPGMPAEISIVREKVKKGTLPGLSDIRKAVEASEKPLRNFPETDKAVPKILAELKKEEFDTLFFVDNGTGLNERNMYTILSDGASDKTTGIGSYGNGHIVAFVFSGLRYVLYAGVSEEGSIGSGHTMLASHVVDGCKFGKDGILARNFRGSEEFDFDYYPTKDFDSTVIADMIEKISKKSTYGSAVIIPAFSIDENREDIVKKIKRYASLHFFPAILEDKLSISYHGYNSEKLDISSKNIRSIAEEFGEEFRSRGLKGGPKGKYIYEGVNTYVSSNEVFIKTENGSVRCFLRESNDSRLNINLFRDGMWITDVIVGWESKFFAELKPFDLVVNVSKEDDPVLYDLIRASEGSLHMHLEKRVGHEYEWTKLKQLLVQVREDLIDKHLTKETYEEISFPDFASLDVSDNPHSQNVPKTGRWVRKRIIDPPPPPPPPPPPGSNEYFEILGDQADIHGQLVRNGDGFRAHLKSESDVSHPEVRVAELLGVDDACDSSGHWRFSDVDYCEIEEIKINDKAVNLKKKGVGIRKPPSASGEVSGVYAVRIDSLKKNELVEVQATFKSGLGDPRSSIKLEIVKRDEQKAKRAQKKG